MPAPVAKPGVKEWLWRGAAWVVGVGFVLALYQLFGNSITGMMNGIIEFLWQTVLWIAALMKSLIMIVRDVFLNWIG